MKDWPIGSSISVICAGTALRHMMLQFHKHRTVGLADFIRSTVLPTTPSQLEDWISRSPWESSTHSEVKTEGIGLVRLRSGTWF